MGAIYLEFGGWAWGGATVGATNAWLGGATSAGDIVTGASIGIISSYAGGLAGQWGGQYIGSVVINGTHINSPVLQGVVTGAIGGAAGGYAGGFTSLIMTGDFREANQAGLKGAAFGAPTGGISGSVSAYRYSVKNDINPWDGKILNTNNTNIQFGNNPNQEYHTFRHTDDIGLSRFEVRSAVESNVQMQSNFIEIGKPFNQVIIVNGQRIQYTAYKLPNGTINIGRIHGIK